MFYKIPEILLLPACEFLDFIIDLTISRSAYVGIYG